MRPLSLVGLLVLAGCASSSPEGFVMGAPGTDTRVRHADAVVSPVRTTYEGRIASGSLPAPPDVVWRALPSVFAELGFEPNRLDSRERVMGVVDARTRTIAGTRPSRFLNCGQGPTGANADSYSITLTLLAHVRAAEGSGSVVELRLEGTGRDVASSGRAVTCSTLGVLEARFLDLLGERVAGAGA